MLFEPSNRRGCCWPMWPHDSKPTHKFCGDPKTDGSSYCLKHKTMSVRAPDEESQPYIPYKLSRRAA